jgi:hypothetical protein
LRFEQIGLKRGWRKLHNRRARSKELEQISTSPTATEEELKALHEKFSHELDGSRNDHPSSFSAFALGIRRTVPSSNNWPRTSLSKRSTILTKQSGSLQAGNFFALSPKRSLRTFAISAMEDEGA